MTRGDGESRETAKEFESKELHGGLDMDGTFIFRRQERFRHCLGEPRTTAAKLFPGLPTQDLNCNADISCPKLHGYIKQQFSQT